MYDNICTATGTTSSINEDITEAIKQQTKFKDTDFLFSLKKANIFCDKSTNIYLNTEDSFISQGLNKISLKSVGDGEFAVATDVGDILITRIVISESGTTYTITFTY